MRQRRQPPRSADVSAVATHDSPIAHLSRALSTLQPLPEMGQGLAANLRALWGLTGLVLATYDELAQRLHFRTAVLDGHAVDWPDSPLLEHPFADVVRQVAPRDLAASELTDESWHAVPLRFAGSVLGVLAVAPASAGATDLETLHVCAELLGTAVFVLEHVDSLEQLVSEQSAMLASIGEIARELNATVDAREIGDIVLRHALDASSAQAAAILLCDDAAHLTLLSQRKVDPSVVDALAVRPVSVAELSPENLNREYWAQPVEAVPPALRLRSKAAVQLCLPLRRDAKLIGVLLLAVDTARPIGPIQLHVLKQLATQTALALANARAYGAITRQRQLLDRRLVQLQAVAHISQAISAHLNLDALLDEIVAVVQHTLGYRTALLSLVETHAPQQVRRVAARGIPPEAWRDLQRRVVPIEQYRALMAEDFRISRSFYIPHDHQRAGDIDLVQIVEQGYRPELGSRASGEWHADDLLLVPLYGHRGSLVGFLSVDDPSDRQRPTSETITVLEIFGTQAATAIENARMFAEMERQALTDNLTGLANQRHMMLHLEQQVAQAERHQQQLALLALDIDHFKSFNDSFGHLAGNVVLREFATLIRQSVRAGDHVARWGGEEFLALLPETTSDGALEVAERIRQAVRRHAFPHRAVSVSIGVALFNPGMSDLDLLSAADGALYRAKSTRDTVSL